jgi:hypothetical protein
MSIPIIRKKVFLQRSHLPSWMDELMVRSLVLKHDDVVPQFVRAPDPPPPSSSPLLQAAAAAAVALSEKCGGRLGSGSGPDAQPPPSASIAVTSAMVGRSAALSCTHSSATLTHRTMLATSPHSPSAGSTSSCALPSLHSCHACDAALLMRHADVDEWRLSDVNSRIRAG